MQFVHCLGELEFGPESRPSRSCQSVIEDLRGYMSKTNGTSQPPRKPYEHY